MKLEITLRSDKEELKSKILRSTISTEAKQKLIHTLFRIDIELDIDDQTGESQVTKVHVCKK